MVTLRVGPISSSLQEVSTWRFRAQKHLHARKKRLHCRLIKSALNETGKNETNNRKGARRIIYLARSSNYKIECLFFHDIR